MPIAFYYYYCMIAKKHVKTTEKFDMPNFKLVLTSAALTARRPGTGVALAADGHAGLDGRRDADHGLSAERFE